MPEGERSTVEYNYLIGRKQKATLNSHELNRSSVWGMILNTGPTQTHTDPSTGEILNQHFKFSTENPGAYIIPGFYPQGDLLSVFVTAGAPLLGIAAGATDNKYIDDFKKQLWGETNALRYHDLEKYIPERGGGGEKSTLTEDDLKKLYGDRIVVNNYANVRGNHRGNVNINFPDYEGRSAEGSKSKNAFGEALNFKPGSEAEYLLRITGELDEGSSIVRKHEDK